MRSEQPSPVRWRIREGQTLTALIDVPPGTSAEAVDPDSLYECFEQLLALPDRREWIVDMRGRRFFDPVRRRKLAEWVRLRRPVIAARVRRAHVVVESRVQESALRALLWVAPFPIEVLIHVSVTAALTSIREGPPPAQPSG